MGCYLVGIGLATNIGKLVRNAKDLFVIPYPNGNETYIYENDYINGMEQSAEEKEKILFKQVLTCTDCYSYLVKLNKGQFTIAQLSQHFSKKYRNIQWHVDKLRKVGLVESVNLGGMMAGRWKRHLYQTSQKGKLALLEKGDLNG